MTTFSLPGYFGQEHEVAVMSVTATWDAKAHHYVHDYPRIPEGYWQCQGNSGTNTYKNVGAARRGLRQLLKTDGAGFRVGAKFLIHETKFVGRSERDQSQVAIYCYESKSQPLSSSLSKV